MTPDEPVPPGETPPWGPQLTPYGAVPPAPRPSPPARRWPYLAVIAVLALTTLAAGLEAVSKDNAVHTAQHEYWSARSQFNAGATAYRTRVAQTVAALNTERSQLLLAQSELAARGQHENEVYAAVAACAADVNLAATDHGAGNDAGAAAALAAAQPVCAHADQMAMQP